KDIQKRNLKKRFGKPSLKKLRQIAIDEISIGKGHRYLSVVLDLVRGAVVFVGEGKGTKALLPFFRKLRRSKCHIEAVAMDMSPAYISAVQEHLPGAVPSRLDRPGTRIQNSHVTTVRQYPGGPPDRDPGLL
ncbi:MAG: transposase, partial [Deltaproteobacteria bacterium]|nr:transposase [Deltaproteobacteria bacterium]